MIKRSASETARSEFRLITKNTGRPIMAAAIAAVLLAGAVDLVPKAAWATTFLERAQQYYEERDFRAAEIELKNALQREPDNAKARALRGRVLLKLGDAAGAETELLRAQEFGYDGRDLELLLAQARLKLRRYSAVASAIPRDLSIESEVERDLYVARGEALMGLGQFDEALAIFERVLRDGPHGAALANKARIAGALGDMAEARELLDQALAVAPQQELVVSTEAAWRLQAREFEAAKNAYQRAIEIDSTDLLSHIGLIHSHLALGEINEAADIVKSLRARQPDNLLIVLQDAIVQFLQHNYRAARTEAERVLAANQNLPQALVISGYSAFQLQEYEQARRHLSIYLTQRPQDKEVRAVLGATLLKLGYKQEAYSLMTALGEDIPDTTAYLSVLTSAAAGVDNPVATLRYLKRLGATVPDDAVIQEKLGIALLAAGETEDGIATLQRTLQLNPLSERAYAFLFGAYVQRGKLSEALGLSKHMQDAFPDMAVGHTLEGIVHINAGDNKNAEAALRRALENDPAAPDAVRNLAQLLLAEKRVDDAREVFNEALARTPSDANLLSNYALLERGVGNEEKAQMLLRRAMQDNPKSWQVRSLLALSLLQTGDIGEALMIARSALAENPNNPQIMKTVSLALLQSGNPVEALEFLNRVVEAIPADARAHEYRSLALEQSGRVSEAEAALEEALILEPESSDLQIARASLLLKLGRLDESKKIVASLKEASSEDERVLVLQGRLALLENKPGEAAASFEAAFSKSQSNLLLLDLVNAKFRAGQREEAMKLLEGWLADNSEDSLVWHRRAEYLMALEQWNEAKTSYEAVLAYRPDDARALNNLAWVKMELGETDGALAMARKAASLAPRNVTVNDTLAMALLRSGQEKEAVDLLRSITKSAPNDRTLRFHLAQALSATGNVEEAVDELRRILGDSTPFRERAEAEALLASLTQ